MKNREKVEAWVVNLSRPAATSGKYLGTYYQGYLTSFETEAAAEDLATVSMDYSADGSVIPYPGQTAVSGMAALMGAGGILPNMTGVMSFPST